jgi:uncharacterized protein
VNPFYLGTSERPLFGLHHPPKGRPTRASAVLLCAPLGQEYMRSHRALRQLAQQLARAGFHVLRFDYFGTGDSAGDGEDATVEQWLSDIDVAAAELRDASGARALALVGLRLGGALAAVAAGGRNDVTELVLWDPVVHGGRYAAELVAAADRPEGHMADRSGTLSVNGFPVPAALRAGLGRLDLTALTPQARRTTVIVSAERPEYLALRNAWQAAGVSLSYRPIASAGNWDDLDRLGAALLPQEIIQGIVACLTEEVAA